MAQKSIPMSESKVRETESKSFVWELKNWKATHHVLVAGQASCRIQFETPNVTLRFYFQPVDIIRRIGRTKYQIRYYSLCADVSQSSQFNGSVKINTKTHLDDGTVVPFDGEITLGRSSQTAGIVVVDEFMAVRLWGIDESIMKKLLPFSTASNTYKLLQQQDISINFHVTLFELNENGSDDMTRTHAPKQEFEGSMQRHVKALYAAEDNFADLMLETKDNMTLSAHKFQLAARSPVFRTMIKDALNKQGFDGVINIDDMNAKPLVVILHWMYTDELHENTEKVMEEVVEAARKYELGDLLKILDKKLIFICNAGNMFQLFQVAKSIPLPTSVNDISVSHPKKSRLKVSYYLLQSNPFLKDGGCIKNKSKNR